MTENPNGMPSFLGAEPALSLDARPERHLIRRTASARHVDFFLRVREALVQRERSAARPAAARTTGAWSAANRIGRGSSLEPDDIAARLQAAGRYLTRPFFTATRRSTKMPGVTMSSGSSSPGSTTSSTWAMVTRAAAAMMLLKLRIEPR